MEKLTSLCFCFKGHCYKPDQKQTWNPFYLWKAAPKLLKQLSVFRLSSAELWQRSLVINQGQATFMDAKADQAQQQKARQGLDASSHLCHWLQWSQSSSGVENENRARLCWTAPQKHHHYVKDPAKSCQSKSVWQHQTGCSLLHPHSQAAQPHI